jgi:hypothetical protein
MLPAPSLDEQSFLTVLKIVFPLFTPNHESNESYRIKIVFISDYYGFIRFNGGSVVQIEEKRRAITRKEGLKMATGPS